MRFDNLAGGLLRFFVMGNPSVIISFVALLVAVIVLLFGLRTVRIVQARRQVSRDKQLRGKTQLTQITTPESAPEEQTVEDAQPPLSQNQIIEKLTDEIRSGKALLWLGVRKVPLMIPFDRFLRETGHWVDKTNAWLTQDLGDRYAIGGPAMRVEYPGEIPAAASSPISRVLKEAIDNHYYHIVQLERILEELQSEGMKDWERL